MVYCLEYLVMVENRQVVGRPLLAQVPSEGDRRSCARRGDCAAGDVKTQRGRSSCSLIPHVLIRVFRIFSERYLCIDEDTVSTENPAHVLKECYLAGGLA